MRGRRRQPRALDQRRRPLRRVSLRAPRTSSPATRTASGTSSSTTGRRAPPSASASDSTGDEGDGDSGGPSSCDQRRRPLRRVRSPTRRTSSPGDTNGDRDVFVRDRQDGHHRARQRRQHRATEGERRAAIEPCDQRRRPLRRVRVLATQPRRGRHERARRTSSSTTAQTRHDRARERRERGRARATATARSPVDQRRRPLRRVRVLATNLVAGRHERRRRRLRPRPADRHHRARERRQCRHAGEMAAASSACRSAPTAASSRSTRDATNLVAGDTNGALDVFVHDRQTGDHRARERLERRQRRETTTVGLPSISADGRFVAFESEATNLVAGDTNGRDVFVRDRNTPDSPTPTGRRGIINRVDNCPSDRQSGPKRWGWGRDRRRLRHQPARRADR